MAKQAYAEKGYLAAYKIARRKKKMLPLVAQRWASKQSGYTPIGLRKKVKPLKRKVTKNKPVDVTETRLRRSLTQAQIDKLKRKKR